MKTKTMRILGVTLFIVGLLGLLGAILFWFMHYYFMQEGYYHFGDSFMVACAVLGLCGLLLYPAIPLLIVSKVRKNRESLQNTVEYTSAEAAEYCIACGEKHSANANFCTKCGQRFR